MNDVPVLAEEKLLFLETGIQEFRGTIMIGSTLCPNRKTDPL